MLRRLVFGQTPPPVGLVGQICFFSNYPFGAVYKLCHPKLATFWNPLPHVIQCHPLANPLGLGWWYPNPTLVVVRPLHSFATATATAQTRWLCSSQPSCSVSCVWPVASSSSQTTTTHSSATPLWLSKLSSTSFRGNYLFLSLKNSSKLWHFLPFWGRYWYSGSVHVVSLYVLYYMDSKYRS